MERHDLSGEIFERRYQIVERLAEGAMGVVYRGIRLKLDRAVAIKVMHSSLPGEMEGRKRFEREAKLMARLEHPHCVSIIDYGLHEKKPYVVMELVRGRSLHDVIVDQRRFEIPRAVDVMCQILSGLSHAHEQGIIHRDIKPANIMITPKAPLGVHVRILDFGLARMFGSTTSLSNGVAVGTPSYMAPEQCRGDQLDARVDVYACGVVLFEMLTGKKPFVASDPIAIIRKHLEERPPRLADVATGDYGVLEAVVARALAKSPDDRFPSAVAMAEALDAALTGRSSPGATAAFAMLGSSAVQPSPSSIEIPITTGSAVSAVQPTDSTALLTSAPPPELVAELRAEPLPQQPPPTRAPAARKRPVPHDDSVRRLLPVSRLRYFVLAGLIVAAAAIVGIVVLRSRFADRAAAGADAGVTVEGAPAVIVVADAAPDPVVELLASATRLAEAGKLEAAIEVLVDARRDYPDRAVLALSAGKLYFARLWWNDGLVQLRDALRMEPTLRGDPDLIKTAIRGFLTTPGYDDRLGRFLVELGAPAAPLLDDAARTHPNPQKRARAAALLRKLR